MLLSTATGELFAPFRIALFHKRKEMMVNSRPGTAKEKDLWGEYTNGYILVLLGYVELDTAQL